MNKKRPSLCETKITPIKKRKPLDFTMSEESLKKSFNSGIEHSRNGLTNNLHFLSK